MISIQPGVSTTPARTFKRPVKIQLILAGFSERGNKDPRACFILFTAPTCMHNDHAVVLALQNVRNSTPDCKQQMPKGKWLSEDRASERRDQLEQMMSSKAPDQCINMLERPDQWVHPKESADCANSPKKIDKINTAVRQANIAASATETAPVAPKSTQNPKAVNAHIIAAVSSYKDTNFVASDSETKPLPFRYPKALSVKERVAMLEFK
jgi:hypothetical protein